jgi:2-oxoglutarate dehydrogenase E2 component (dihydrolipoamide succinyltransferase)
MSQINVVMPKMGESVMEATITKWLKNEGDKIEEDEALLEIATDKVDSEVPSPVTGIILKKLFKEGDVVKIDTIIAEIVSENRSSALSSPKTEELKALKSEKAVTTQVANSSIEEENNSFENATKFYSPLVKNIANQENIPLVELENLKGTGKNGRVTKNDLLSYLSQRGDVREIKPLQSKQEIKPEIQAISPEPVKSFSGEVEIIEMDRMRKLIADHMVMSKHTSPHVTSFVEADVTNLVVWRDKIKNQFEKRESEKITFTPIFIEAVVKAIKDLPRVNVSVDGSKIILKKFINIGMATALPSGNLIVPVIKNADQLSLLGLTKKVNDLANRARNSQLKPDEIQDGTFTITNVGSFGNVMGTPIINQPQAAILAVGAIRKKPAVIETPQGDTIGIRHMMFLSLSYDHRVVDGALGGSFVRKVADYLEKFDLNRSL